MTDEQLAKIRGRVEAASPGPWVVNVNGECVSIEDAESDETVCYFWADGVELSYPFDNYLLNSEFSAHSRTDVPLLLAEIDRLNVALKNAASEMYDFRVAIGKNLPAKPGAVGRENMEIALVNRLKREAK